MDQRNKQVKQIIEAAAKELEGMGVKYVIGTVDRQKDDPNGGKAFFQSDVKGEDFQIILGLALPDRQDKVNAAIWLGNLLEQKD